MGLKGLLEMMYGVMEAWMDSFVEDFESSYDLSGPRPGSSSRRASASGSVGGGGGGGGQPSPAGSSCNTTFKIRLIQAEAAVNGDLGERVAQWAAVFRERTEELRAAVEEWQAKRAPGAHRLTTGFLEGSHPVVGGLAAQYSHSCPGGAAYRFPLALSVFLPSPPCRWTHTSSRSGWSTC